MSDEKQPEQTQSIQMPKVPLTKPWVIRIIIEILIVAAVCYQAPISVSLFVILTALRFHFEDWGQYKQQYMQQAKMEIIRSIVEAMGAQEQGLHITEDDIPLPISKAGTA